MDEEFGTTASFAPIAVFAYNRPRHLERCLAALAANPQSRACTLYIYSDGPLDEAVATRVEEVRSVCRQARGFQSVHLIERKTNLGLAASIIAGVTELCADYGKVIVLEDDLVVSPQFLKFMNDGLKVYAEDASVAAVHGYMFPVGRSLPETFFLTDPGCWGWATWKRAWDVFEPDGKRLLDEIFRQDRVQEFNIGGAYDYFGMLADQCAGRNRSWAVRWYASVFLRNMLTLHPCLSLVSNEGKDGSGTHDSISDKFSVEVSMQSISVNRIEIEEDMNAKASLIAYLNSLKEPVTKRYAAAALRRISGLLSIAVVKR